ncbi:DUF3341 domain-containing protein [Methylocystis sp. IM3]|uniref:DUF3341 domain-containing protein n=2 Tax=Methylocystis TaxID=133 RepID=UPI0030F6F47C
MKSLLLAEFVEPEAMVRAARKVDEAGCRLLDAFSPFPVEEVEEFLGARAPRLRVYMFFGGLIVVAAAYATEGWSAIFDYPIDSGGRPLNSWPAFILFPFAVGIFGAALTGFIFLLIETRLPSLHHPLFSVQRFERATQDRFFLALEAPTAAAENRRAKAWLREAGAVDVVEVEK